MTTDGRIGGAERLIIDIIRANLDVGAIQPEVCVLLQAGNLGQELRAMGVPVHELRLRRSVGAPLALARLAGIVSRRRFDVVHTHLLHASALGLAAARIANVRLAVMTRHYEQYVWTYGSWDDRLAQWFTNRLAGHIFAVSDAALQVLVGRECVAPDRVTVVPNGVDLARVRRLAKGGETLTAGRQDVITVGSVGSLETRKGHKYLLEAFALLEDSKTRLLLVGDGTLRDELRRQVVDLGIVDRVEFTGYQSNPYEFLARMDIYAQPSVEEGFGIAVIEAMALGIPVVASNTGGLPELVRNGETGVLVPRQDAKSLIGALSRLIADPEFRRAVGRAGRTFVDSRFDAATTAARYTDAYRRLLEARLVGV